VLNALVAKLGRNVQSAYLFNTVLSLEDFFAFLFDEFGLPKIEPFRKGVALHALNQFLIDRLRNGQQTLLLIDEAQNLPLELLEEIRMLSNLETPQSKLLHIALVGQPELMAKLRRPELRQLRQRVELFHVIRPLSPRETGEYVRERLTIAGHETGDLFTASALRSVHAHTRGIPRMINVLCDNTLLGAFARQTQRVSAALVEEAARELGLSENAPSDGLAADRREGWLRRFWPRRRMATEAGA